MVQINYMQGRDELEVVFEEVETPSVVKMDNGVMLEFSSDSLSCIVLPNFGQMIHLHLSEHTNFEFVKFDNEVLRLQIDGRYVNVKIDLSSL